MTFSWWKKIKQSFAILNHRLYSYFVSTNKLYYYHHNQNYWWENSSILVFKLLNNVFFKLPKDTHVYSLFLILLEDEKINQNIINT